MSGAGSYSNEQNHEKMLWLKNEVKRVDEMLKNGIKYKCIIEGNYQSYLDSLFEAISEAKHFAQTRNEKELSERMSTIDNVSNKLLAGYISLRAKERFEHYVKEEKENIKKLLN